MRSIVLVPLVLLSAVAQPVEAGGGKQVRYVGIHPVPASHGGGLCYIEGPHVHVFPANKLEYRDHVGHHYFVGDPVAYGYDGPRHAYSGHHPIHVHAVVGDEHEDVEFCYLDGPHFHAFAPPPAVEAEFALAGDAYFYVAEPPEAYVTARPAMVKVNAIYKPLVYTRPVIEVEPPAGWIGVRFAAPAVVVERPKIATPEIVTPGIHAEVAIPMPSISVSVGLGAGVVVHGHEHHKHKHKHKHKHRKHRKHR